MNVNDNKVVTVTVVRNGWGMPLCKRCDEKIDCDKISVNVGKLKREKSSGVNEIRGQYLKRDGDNV